MPSCSDARIAAQIGYQNQAAFAKAFRETMGMSPTDYRRSRC